MILLPYVQLPFYEGELKVDCKESIDGLDNEFLDVCHLLKTDKQHYFQIGFYHSSNGSVYTHKSRIHEVHNELVSFVARLPWYIVEELQKHLGHYCKVIDYVPAWGEDEYYDLVAAGKTDRRLDGPHKTGMLGRGESRLVAFKKDRSLAFGPKLNYLSALEKSKKLDEVFAE